MFTLFPRSINCFAAAHNMKMGFYWLVTRMIVTHVTRWKFLINLFRFILLIYGNNINLLIVLKISMLILNFVVNNL